MRKTLTELYDDCRSTPSDIFEHLEYMHDLVVEHNAQTVVELGVRSGNSTAALLAAVERTGGHLWSVDVCLIPQTNYVLFARAAGVTNRGDEGALWTFIIGNDLEVAHRLPERIDVLFIDTSHTFAQTLAELRLYGPRADVVLLHDTMLERPDASPPSDPSFPVRAAVDVYLDESGRSFTNFEHCYGLGVIR